MGAKNLLAEKEKNGFKKAYPWVRWGMTAAEKVSPV